MPGRPRGFTIVELLMVVAIIALLVALITPAVSKAMYEAELTQCSARQDATASGAIAYATDHKRHYPLRPGLPGGPLDARNGGGVEVYELATKRYGGTPAEQADFRSSIIKYIGPKLWSCPFVDEVDLTEPATAASDQIMGGYGLWFGFQYAGHRAMRRLGDRFTWTWNGTEYRFDAMVSDVDFVMNPDTFSFGSHPDADHRMSLLVSKDEDRGLLAGNFTGAFYTKKNDGIRRGPIDMNVAHQDGSVRRSRDVTHYDDPRMVRVPPSSRTELYLDGNGEWLHLPR